MSRNDEYMCGLATFIYMTRMGHKSVNAQASEASDEAKCLCISSSNFAKLDIFNKTSSCRPTIRNSPSIPPR